jgi:hypothetical protein
MAHIRTTRTTAYRLLTTIALALALTTSVQAQAPRPGEVQRLTVITISMQAGSTEKERKRVTYTPPPGWYVRSHRVHCTKKTGHSSFSVATVPQDWGWASEEKVEESYKTLIELAAKARDHGLQARLAVEKGKVLGELRKVRSSHHALVVDATAKGEGFLRSNGIIELTVSAEMVFIGTDDTLYEAAARHCKTLSKPPDKPAPPPAKRAPSSCTPR